MSGRPTSLGTDLDFGHSYRTVGRCEHQPGRYQRTAAHRFVLVEPALQVHQIRMVFRQEEQSIIGLLGRCQDRRCRTRFLARKRPVGRPVFRPRAVHVLSGGQHRSGYPIGVSVDEQVPALHVRRTAVGLLFERRGLFRGLHVHVVPVIEYAVLPVAGAQQRVAPVARHRRRVQAGRLRAQEIDPHVFDHVLQYGTEIFHTLRV